MSESSMIGTVAQELWDQLCFLSDPTTKWVHDTPDTSGQCCAVARCYEYLTVVLTYAAVKILEDAICQESKCLGCQMNASVWNDDVAKNRKEVLWVLREAYELAVWLEI